MACYSTRVRDAGRNSGEHAVPRVVSTEIGPFTLPSGAKFQLDQGKVTLMTDFATRLETADERINKAENVLRVAGRVLEAAEKAQAAAERSGTDLRTVNLVVVAGAIAIAVIAIVARRQH